MCTPHLGLPAARGVSGLTKAQAAGLCIELEVPHESNCILCAHKNRCRVAIIILNTFLSLQILTVFDFPA